MAKSHKAGIFHLALRNLSRNKIKTILSMTAIIAGVAYFLYISCLYSGIKMASFRSLINYETAAATIYPSEYYPIKSELPLYQTMNFGAKIEEALNNQYLTAPRVRFSGMVLGTEAEIPFTLIGVDPVREQKIFLYPRDVLTDNAENKDARFIDSGKYEMVMGIRGALELGVKVGDSVRVSALAEFLENGRIRTIQQILDFTLVGLVNSDNPRLNKYTAFVPLDMLQDESGLMLNGGITEIAVRKKGFDFQKLPSAIESPKYIESLLPADIQAKVKVVDWSDYAADFLTTMAQDPVQILFYFFIVLVIVLISNTMLLSAMDRTREIGILRAMGMDDFDIFRMFALEAGLLGFFGAVIGLCIGAGISWIFVNNGITVTSEMLELLDKPYPVVGRIYAAWDYPAFFIAGIVSIVTAVVSAVIPTLSALKINIIEAIKMN